MTGLFRMHRLISLGILLLFVSSLNAASLPVSDLVTPLLPDQVGFLLYDAQTHKELAALNADKKFSYASNLKLLTTAAALHYLGGGFHYITLFRFDKNSGTLSIKAGGDPSVTYEEIDRIAYQLKAKGIHGIQKVVIDNTMFGPKGSYRIPGSGNGDNAYLALLSPLSLEMNAVDIAVKAEQVGKPVTVTISAGESHFIVANSAVGTADAENRLIIGTTAAGTHTKVIVKGSVGVKRTKAVTISRRVARPALRYVSALMQAMGEQPSVPVSFSPLPLSLFNNGTTLLHKGRPLREIVRIMNLYSSNMMAETLVFTLGVLFKGDARQGVSVLKEFAKIATDMAPDIINGCGLGNGKNFIKPRFFIKLVAYMAQQSKESIDFFGSLPVMGEDGTLQKWGEENCHGEIRAKTGTLTGVTALTGLLFKHGQPYLFTFVVNDFPAKRFTPVWRFRDRFMAEVRRRIP